VSEVAGAVTHVKPADYKGLWQAAVELLNIRFKERLALGSRLTKARWETIANDELGIKSPMARNVWESAEAPIECRSRGRPSKMRSNLP
jgi:hypothetical protein